jgi:hypothetical protein
LGQLFKWTLKSSEDKIWRKQQWCQTFYQYKIERHLIIVKNEVIEACLTCFDYLGV